MAAIDDLNSLLSGLPNYASLTTGMKNAALAGALIPDVDGVWPGSTDPLYVTTYDIYFAAINLIGFLKAQPVVRQTSSEGTSVAVDAPDWSTLLGYFRSMSPIISATGHDVLQIVAIPEVPHVKRVSMSYGGEGYDDVDTDLA
jgi:hypothetical protein